MWGWYDKAKAQNGLNTFMILICMQMLDILVQSQSLQSTSNIKKNNFL
jgi:hypothetical protein